VGEAERLALLGGPPGMAADDRPQWPCPTPGAVDLVARSLEGEAFYYGPSSTARRLEDEFAAYHGRAHAQATDSGTTALLLAFFATGLGGGIWALDPHAPSPEVLVAGYGFFATASPLLHIGATPVFCDVDPVTGNLDVTDAARRLTDRTRGLVVTHLAGHPADMDAVVAFCQRHGLVLVEDCSHAHGARYRSRVVGTFSAAAAFSCQSGKMLSAGEGGLLLTDDPDVLTRAAALANIRRLEGSGLDCPPDLQLTGFGLKHRMSPLSAAYALHHLRHLDELCEARRSSLDHIGQRLGEATCGRAVAPPTASHVSRGAFYEYPIRVEVHRRDGVSMELLVKALRAENVPIAHSNTQAIHRLPVFGLGLEGVVARSWGRDAGRVAHERLPVAEQLEEETMFLAPFTGTPIAVLDRCLRAIGKVFGQLDVLGGVSSADTVDNQPVHREG